jgi:hypothetical protein
MGWLRGTSISDAVGRRAARRPLKRFWSGVSTIESFPHLTLRAEVRTQGRHPCTLDPGLDPMFMINFVNAWVQ